MKNVRVDVDHNKKYDEQILYKAKPFEVEIENMNFMKLLSWQHESIKKRKEEDSKDLAVISLPQEKPPIILDVKAEEPVELSIKKPKASSTSKKRSSIIDSLR